MRHLLTRIAYWLTRHIVQRLIAPRLIDERDGSIEHLTDQVDRWTQTALARRRDNRKLMGEVCGRIADFKGAASRLSDVRIYDVDPDLPRFHFALPRDRTLTVQRTGFCEAVPMQKHEIDLQDFAARCRIGLERPDDYDPEQLRLATGVILIDKLARFISLHVTTGSPNDA